jgi:hypothetical protein
MFVIRPPPARQERAEVFAAPALPGQQRPLPGFDVQGA